MIRDINRLYKEWLNINRESSDWKKTVEDVTSVKIQLAAWGSMVSVLLSGISGL